MKKNNLLTIGLLSVSTMVMADISYLSKEKIEELSKSSKFLSNSYTRIIEGVDENNTYFLNLQYKGKNVNCFIDKSTGSIYVGDRYNANGKKSEFINSPMRIAKLTQSIKNGVSFSYGEGKKDLYLFTDPECPYCRKFERQAKGLLEEYTVHVVLFPLGFHKRAPAMTEWIMQGKNEREKFERAEAVMIKGIEDYRTVLPKDANKPFAYSANTEKAIKKGKIAARMLQVRGTPTIFDSNFNRLNWGKLLQKEQSKKFAIKK